MDISEGNTVYYLKQKIEEQQNIRVEEERLLFHGYPLQDESTIDAYHIYENAVICLLHLCTF
jgi:hypothetical protein